MVTNQDEIPESHPQFQLYKRLRDAGVSERIAREAIVGLGKDDLFLYTAADNLQAYEMKRKQKSLDRLMYFFFFVQGVAYTVVGELLWRVFTK